jgi:hypothetical protein
VAELADALDLGSGLVFPYLSLTIKELSLSIVSIASGEFHLFR